MNNQNNNDAWTTFWCGLILLAAIWSVYDWYTDTYFPYSEVVVPTKR